MNDYIQHFGVLGMKWGVRKQRPKSNIKSKKRKITREEQESNYKFLNKHSLMGMTGGSYDRRQLKKNKIFKNVATTGELGTLAKKSLVDYDTYRSSNKDKKLKKQADKSYKQFNKAAEKTVKELLGKYANKSLYSAMGEVKDKEGTSKILLQRISAKDLLHQTLNEIVYDEHYKKRE